MIGNGPKQLTQKKKEYVHSRQIKVSSYVRSITQQKNYNTDWVLLNNFCLNLHYIFQQTLTRIIRFVQIVWTNLNFSYNQYQLKSKRPFSYFSVILSISSSYLNTKLNNKYIHFLKFLLFVSVGMLSASICLRFLVLLFCSFTGNKIECTFLII